MIAQFLTKINQVLLIQSSFQKRARINAGRSVALKINLIRPVGMIGTVEEMVEGDFIQSRRRSVSRNMAAGCALIFVGTHHHRHRVPADNGADAPLDLLIARIRRLRAARNSVDVRRVGRKRNRHAFAMRVAFELFEQLRDALRLSFTCRVLCCGAEPFCWAFSPVTRPLLAPTLRPLAVRAAPLAGVLALPLEEDLAATSESAFAATSSLLAIKTPS
jgi:hypothetical protein